MKIRFEKPPSAPDVHNDLSVRYAATKRQFPRLRWYLLVAAILSVPGFFVARILLGFLVVEAPAFVVMPNAVLTSPVNGRIESIAEPEEKVAAGETLAIISPFYVETTPSHPKLQSVKSALALTEQVLSMRRSQMDEIRRLYDLGAATDADLANAKSLWFTAFSQVNLAKQAIENQMQRQQPSAPAPIMVRSPFSGIVSSQEAQTGLWVSAGSDLLTVNGEQKLWIRAYLNPQDVQYAKIGIGAVLVFNDNRHFDAKVMAVEPEAVKTPMNFTSPLSSPTEAIILKLVPLKPLPPEYRIFNLPLTVRFNRF